MKYEDFYLIGEGSTISKTDVSQDEWDSTWLWAIKNGIRIMHYRVFNPYRLMKVRWREGVKEKPKPDVQYIDIEEMDLYQCMDCGAHAEDEDDIQHYPACVPGESKWWQQFYAKEGE